VSAASPDVPTVDGQVGERGDGLDAHGHVLAARQLHQGPDAPAVRDLRLVVHVHPCIYR
jgi:hypothetical protein